MPSHTTRLLIGLTAAIATTACPPPERSWDGSAPDGTGYVSLLNRTHEVQILGLRSLDQRLVLDCDYIRADPAKVLTLEHFGHSIRAELFSGGELALGPYYPLLRQAWEWDDGYFPADDFSNRGPCDAMYVEVDQATDIIALWAANELEIKEIFEYAPIPKDVPPDPQTIVLDADYSGTPAEAMNFWYDHPCGSPHFGLSTCPSAVAERISTRPEGAVYTWSTVFDRPLHAEVFEEVLVPESCAVATHTPSLAWPSPPSQGGVWTVIGLIRGDFACPAIMLDNGFGEYVEWPLCLPDELLAPLDPERAHTIKVEFRTNDRLQHDSNERYRSINLEIRHFDEGQALVRSGSLSLIRGQALPDQHGLEFSAVPRQACPGVVEREECPNRIVPVDFTLRSGAREFLLAPGESVELSPNTGRRFDLHAAYHRIIADSRCLGVPYLMDLDARIGLYFEATTLIGFPDL